MAARTAGISRGLLDLRRLVLLREVFRTGTISGAAEALSYSSSAVSQQLSRLQADLGVKLLEHVGRNVFLTPAAEVLVARVELILNSLEDIDAEITAVSAGGQQLVRIGAFQSFTTIFAARLVSAALSASPDLELNMRQVEPEAAIAELTARRLDFVVIDEFPGLPVPRAAHVHKEFVISERLIPYFPKGYAAGRESDLAALSWASEPRGTATHDLVVSTCREHGFEPRIVFESVDFETHRRLVESGAAAAFLPEKFLRLGPVDAQPIHTLGGALERQIYTVVREGSQHFPTIRLLRRLIAALFADDPPSAG